MYCSFPCQGEITFSTALLYTEINSKEEPFNGQVKNHAVKATAKRMINVNKNWIRKVPSPDLLEEKNGNCNEGKISRGRKHPKGIKHSVLMCQQVQNFQRCFSERWLLNGCCQIKKKKKSQKVFFYSSFHYWPPTSLPFLFWRAEKYFHEQLNDSYRLCRWLCYWGWVFGWWGFFENCVMTLIWCQRNYWYLW